MEKEHKYNGETYKETKILCFNCRKRFGIDCPGREPNESTRCIVCFRIFMRRMRKEQAEHIRKYKNAKERNR